MNTLLLLAVTPLILGWILDLIIGDPERLPHPVVYFGKWISFWEKRLNKENRRKEKGALFAISSVALTYILVRSLLDWLISSSTTISISIFCILQTIAVFYCLAGHTLRKEVRMVFAAVDRSIEDGRKQVSRIVGRDTSELSAQECRTAALETLAENLSDGVIAPFFWLLMLGVPGMMAYKMINTLDSMIGYQNERYKEFGCWAAHIDDIANYIPARITALLMIVAYKLHALKIAKSNKQSKRTPKTRSFRSLLAFIATYGPQHASPNSGWPEAALASILDCRFGGPHNYFGEYFYKPFIGTNARVLTSEDMQLSLSICLISEILMLVFIVIPMILNVVFLF